MACLVGILHGTVATPGPKPQHAGGDTRLYTNGWRQQLSGCLVQPRRFARLTQITEILPVEGAEGGFHGGTEAGDAVSDILSQERRPNAGLHENVR